METMPEVPEAMTPKPPPPPRTPERIAASIVDTSRLYSMEEQRFKYIKEHVTAAIQSKQDEIDKLRTRAESAERERDEALEGLRPFAAHACWYAENSPKTRNDWNVLCGLGHCRRAAQIIARHTARTPT